MVHHHQRAVYKYNKASLLSRHQKQQSLPAACQQEKQQEMIDNLASMQQLRANKMQIELYKKEVDA